MRPRTRPLQQGKTAGDGHRPAERGRVGRRDQGEAGVGCRVPPGDDVQARAVARNGHELRSCGQHRPAAGDVAGFLDPDGIAGVDQQLGADPESLLRARRDQDVGRIGHQTPRGRKVLGDRGAQPGQALRIRVARSRRAPARDRGASGPGAGGEEFRRRDAGGQQRQPQRDGAGRHLADRGAAAGEGRGDRRRVGHGWHRFGPCVRQVRRDERARADPAVHVTLRRQPLIRDYHGLPRHAQFVREQPARRQPAAPGKHAVQDRRADVLKNAF